MRCGRQWIVTDGVGAAVLYFEYLGGEMATIAGGSVKDIFFYFISLPTVVKTQMDHFQRYTIRQNCEKCIWNTLIRYYENSRGASPTMNPIRMHVTNREDDLDSFKAAPILGPAEDDGLYTGMGTRLVL